MSVAMIGSPTGGPKSPAADPPVSTSWRSCEGSVFVRDAVSHEIRPKVRHNTIPTVADGGNLRFFID
ncbi:MAG: hypothetical protein ACE1ZA_20240, partial [Pseudomonadales bacterium]